MDKDAEATTPVAATHVEVTMVKCSLDRGCMRMVEGTRLPNHSKLCLARVCLGHIRMVHDLKSDKEDRVKELLGQAQFPEKVSRTVNIRIQRPEFTLNTLSPFSNLGDGGQILEGKLPLVGDTHWRRIISGIGDLHPICKYVVSHLIAKAHNLIDETHTGPSLKFKCWDAGGIYL